MADNVSWETLKEFPTLPDALREIERLRRQAQEWQATAAGFSQDISNAEDEIERLTDEINSLRLQVVALSIPKEARHG